MSIEFIKNYRGSRTENYPLQPIMNENEFAENEESDSDKVDVAYEKDTYNWFPIDVPYMTKNYWLTWPYTPYHFIDGKDRGSTILSLTSPYGFPIPIRLSQIGAIVMRIDCGECRREFAIQQSVLSFVGESFPWYEVEQFSIDLHSANIRLLLAETPDYSIAYDFEAYRKAAQTRSNTEMSRFEEVAVSHYSHLPIIIDGRLEPCSGGLYQDKSPSIGVIKRHHKNYLPESARRVLYELKELQRTPAFSLPNARFPVVSWYLRLSGGNEMPNWGIIRVEVPQGWFEKEFSSDAQRVEYINQISYIIWLYRCRERSYERSPVSLHPIVRAEESLGSLFVRESSLQHWFYRLARV